MPCISKIAHGHVPLETRPLMKLCTGENQILRTYNLGDAKCEFIALEGRSLKVVPQWDVGWVLTQRRRMDIGSIGRRKERSVLKDQSSSTLNQRRLWECRLRG